MNLDKGLSQRMAQLEQINQGYHRQVGEQERELESKAEIVMALTHKLSNVSTVRQK